MQRVCSIIEFNIELFKSPTLFILELVILRCGPLDWIKFEQEALAPHARSYTRSCQGTDPSIIGNVFVGGQKFADALMNLRSASVSDSLEEWIVSLGKEL